MSRTDQWMPFYIGDYLGDTSHLRMAEHGAYVLLLMHYWRTGPLPDDDRALAAIARATPTEWRQVSTAVRQFFTAGDGKLYQKRAEAEKARVAGLSTKRKSAAKARWIKPEGDASAYANGMQTGCKPGAGNEDLHPVCTTQPQPQKDSSSLRSGAEAAPALPMELPPDRPKPIRSLVYSDGLPIIRGLTGQSEAQARTLIGRLLRECQDDCARLHTALREAHDLKPADPVAWLFGAVKRRGGAGPPVERTAWIRDAMAREVAQSREANGTQHRPPVAVI